MSKYKITEEDKERLREVAGKPYKNHRLDAVHFAGVLQGYEYAKNEGNDFSSELDRLIEKWARKKSVEWENLEKFYKINGDIYGRASANYHRRKVAYCVIVLSVLRELKEAVEGKKSVMCEVCKLPTDGVKCFYKRCPVEGKENGK